jgi:hypothetical protein
VQLKNLRDRFDEQGLGQPGRAGDQAVAAGQQRQQDLFDHLALADDDLAELGFDARAARLQAFVGGLLGGGREGLHGGAFGYFWLMGHNVK